MIVGRRVVLTPIAQDDLEVLHRWRISAEYLKFCTHRKNQPTIEEFKQELRSDFNRDRFLQMIIRKRSNLNPVGTVYAYSVNLNDGYGWVSVYTDTLVINRGYGVEGFGLFCAHLFSSLPTLHKLYADVYAYNVHSTRSLVSGGWVLEGTFKEHKVFDSKRYDMLRFALFREDSYARSVILQK